MSDTKKILEQYKNNEISLEDALLELKKEPFQDIGYAKVDLHRKIRQGTAEVIYGEGKTPEQIIGIGIDFTSSTVLPVKRSGTPLCFLDAYRHDPHAYVKLWKHHGAQQYAEKMEEICRSLLKVEIQFLEL